MTGEAWTLSGTLGQPDGTEGRLLAGGTWQLTGGFWSQAVPEGDFLFKDDFER